MTQEALLVAEVRQTLAANADAEKAPQMRAYMKSVLPFYGILAPTRRALLRPVFAAHYLTNEAAFARAVRGLWREAQFREERYAAIDLTGHRYYRSWQTPSMIDLYEELVVTGAWWDFVDEIASRRIGPILRDHPAKIAPLMRNWSTDANLWKRRVSIICQLNSKELTDLDLLRNCLDTNLDDKDFFIRKAIGWALRQYAKTDPHWVHEYVNRHITELSPLSQREALKQRSPKEPQ